jgi:glycosyltransferase involved in cell wall biosynthesis
MKVAVLFHEFEPYHGFKDPGQLVLGLRDLGVEAELVTWRKESLSGYSEVPLVTVETGETARELFWRRSGYDVVVAYTWLREDHLWVPRASRSAGKRVVLKGDTDGQICWPFYPNWDRWLGLGLNWWASVKIAKRRVVGRVRARAAASLLMEQIRLADAVVVETPEAVTKIGYVMARCGSLELVDRLYCIPNPVVPQCADLKVDAKEKTVIAVANWRVKFGDYNPKNPVSLGVCLRMFLARRPDYRAVVVGAGSELVASLAAQSGRAGDRVIARGPLPHEEVLRELSRSRTLVMPSVAEMFPIAAAEAVCLGCSIVGSPIGAFRYLTRGGMNGVVASGFGPDHVLAALLFDAGRWDRGEYDPEEIAEYWRTRLCRREVAKRFLEIFEHIT